MQVRKFLKNYKGIDGRIALNNRLIYLLKEDAMMFLDDSDHDKAIREICITKAREIKAESDGLIKDKEKLTNAVQKLPQLQKKIVNLFYVQRLKAPECCEIMGCTKNQFYYMKESAVQELERMLNEDDTHTVIYKYLEGAGMTVTRDMTQEELVKLLLTEQVELVSVNAPKSTYRRKKKGR